MTLTPAGAVSSAQLSSAAHAVRARLAAEGITVSAPSSARSAVIAAALPGVLTFREIYTDPSGQTYAGPAASPSAEGGDAGTTVTGLNNSSDEPAKATPSPATLAQFASLDCSKNGGRPSAVDEDRHHFVVACDRTRQTKYLLTPADFVGAQVSSADATLGQSPTGQSVGLWEVDMTFNDSAVSQVEKVSSRLFNDNMQRLAITLDGVVVSAPQTNGVLGKNITISGGTPPFSQHEASGLAHILTSGPLPIALTVSS